MAALALLKHIFSLEFFIPTIIAQKRKLFGTETRERIPNMTKDVMTETSGETSGKLAPNWYFQMAQCHVLAVILPLHNASPHDMHLHVMGKNGYNVARV